LKRLYDFISFDKSIKTLSKIADSSVVDDADSQVEAALTQQAEDRLAKSGRGRDRFVHFLRRIDTKHEVLLTRIINAEVLDVPKLNQLKVMA
jgi:hypothetical protein